MNEAVAPVVWGLDGCTFVCKTDKTALVTAQIVLENMTGAEKKQACQKASESLMTVMKKLENEDWEMVDSVRLVTKGYYFCLIATLHRDTRYRR